MKKTKVYLGIMSTGDRVDGQVYRLKELAERYSDEIEMVWPDECVHYFGHDFSRNMYVEKFLESDCDVLWFLDSDVVPPQHIFDLITIHGSKWEVSGAPYPLWMPAQDGDMAVSLTVYNGVFKNEDGSPKSLKMAPTTNNGEEFVDGLATGCLFIKRDVFSQLERPYFQFKRNPETMAVVEGEDLGFALKLSKLGIKFFVDYSMVCRHFKRVDLLEVNNYAISFANNKLMEYDRTIRSQVEAACQAAFIKGRESAMAQARPQPRVTQSGLILPT